MEAEVKKQANQLDYQALDSMVKFWYKQDLLTNLKATGFTYVSEAVFIMYYKKGLSVIDIAKALGYQSKNPVFYWMNKWGFDRRSKGGNVKNPNLEKPGVKAKIISLKGRMPSHEAAKACHCSSSLVQKLWKKSA